MNCICDMNKFLPKVFCFFFKYKLYLYNKLLAKVVFCININYIYKYIFIK